MKNKPAITSLQAANWFIKKSHEEGVSINAMKLQKLIYFAHGWCLALYDTPLIDEFIEAKSYGPVCRAVRMACIKYGSQQIKELVKDKCGNIQFMEASEYHAAPLLEKIWSSYGANFDYIQLSGLATEEGGPWHEARSENPGRIQININETAMKKYFNSKRIDKEGKCDESE
jgi:uncharacterized phage-associated protein